MTVATRRRKKASTPSRESVLTLREVVKTYDGTPVVPALRGVDLEIAAGEFVAIVGPSGSGKSTLLQIAGTLDRPTRGDVRVAGYDVTTLTDPQLSALRAQHIGFVFQQFFLIENQTALDNVADGLLYTGRPLALRRELAEVALRRVDLGERIEHSAAKLSGGERQRVAVARSLVGDPSFVLADEPTGNLDTQTSNTIVELLEEVNAAGTTIIVITHNPEVADRFPRRIGVRDGLIEYDVVSS